MLRSGHRLFSFTYHSPSLQPGNLPYVQSDSDLRVFLDRFEAYFDFFFGEVGGRAITPLGFRDLALQLEGRRANATESAGQATRSEEHTSELQSLMRISYAVFCLKQKNNI